MERARPYSTTEKPVHVEKEEQNGEKDTITVGKTGIIRLESYYTDPVECFSEKAVTKSYKRLIKENDYLFGKFGKRVGKMMRVDRQQYRALVKKHDDYALEQNEICTFIDAKVIRRIDQAVSDDEYQREFAMFIGASSHMLSLLEDFTTYLKDIHPNISQQSEDYFRVVRIDNGKPTCVRIASFSIMDIVDKEEKAAEFSLSQLCQFMIEAGCLRIDPARLQKVLEWNNDILKYVPMHQFIQWQSLKISDFVNSLSEDFLKDIHRVATGTTGIERKSAQRAEIIIHSFLTAQSQVYEALFRPGSEAYREVKNAAMPYLQENAAVGIAVLLSMGINTLDKLAYAYRCIASMHKNGIETEFYSALLASMRNLVHELQKQKFSILTQSDIQKILPIKPSSFVGNHGRKQMESKLISITQRTHAIGKSMRINLDPQDITWHTMLHPDEVFFQHIQNDQSSRNQIHCIWRKFDPQNPLCVRLFFHTKKGGLSWDWNSIEDPRIIEELDYSLLASVVSIGDQIKKKIANMRSVRKTTQAEVRQIESKHAVEITREESTEVASVFFPLSTQEDSILPLIKDFIVIPDSEALEKLTKRFTQTDRERIFDFLSRYNEEGIFRIKKLKKHQGEPLYALRTGNVRIVLRRNMNVANDNGVRGRVFEIETIDFRQSVYKELFY